MGFFGAIIGGIAAAVSTVGTFIGGVCATIGTATGKLGGLIAVGAQKLANAVKNLPLMHNPIFIPDPGIPDINKHPIERAVETVARIGGLISDVSKSMGVDKEPVVADELGYRARVVSEKAPEKFDTKQEYKEYLKSLPVKQEELSARTSEQKFSDTVVGAAIQISAINEKLGNMETSPEFWAQMGAMVMSGTGIKAENINGFIDSLRSAGYTNMDDVMDYLRGTGDIDVFKVGSDLRTALAAGGVEDIPDTLNHMKESARVGYGKTEAGSKPDIVAPENKNGGSTNPEA